jgi:hypothetical protein
VAEPAFGTSNKSSRPASPAFGHQIFDALIQILANARREAKVVIAVTVKDVFGVAPVLTTRHLLEDSPVGLDDDEIVGELANVAVVALIRHAGEPCDNGRREDENAFLAEGVFD